MNTYWQKVEEAIARAAEISPSEYRIWLNEFCGSDEKLKAEIESFLSIQTQAENFLEKDIGTYTAKLFAEDESVFVSKQFGNYRIVREIGQGGMGTVFLANRVDGEFEQEVAIKIVRQAIAGSVMIDRFKRERQILASLNHPNIAKLVDGGVSEEGLPFLAMEFVEADSISKFADRQKLTVEERLKLFLKVCLAVAYAHRNLVVHRDLKPGNILVTPEGEPKLLDFGLAKLLDENLITDAGQTQAAFQALTPAYASPEQLKGEPLTTASDIYSLGIVLYELLTGELPFRFEGKSLAQIIKTVTESDPPLPSVMAISGAKENSSDRKAKIPGPKLHGDLDNIILMALRKEPERRYQSVEQFAADIERHLKGLPVSARPNTFTYLTTKFISRHKVGAAAAGLIFLSLIGGLAATMWQARIARRENAKAEVINTFLQNMLNYSDPDTGLSTVTERDITVKDVLDDAAGRLDNGELLDQPEVRAELQTIIGNSYLSQGKYDAAEKYLREAAEVKTRLYGENNLETVKTLTILASLLLAKSDFAKAEQIYRQILPILRKAQQNGNVKAEVLSFALQDFAVMRRAQGDSREAETLLREGLALRPFLVDKNGTYFSEVAGTLALTLADQGKIDEAESTARELVIYLKQNGQSTTPSFGYNLTALGNYLTEKKNFAEADSVLTEAEGIYRRAYSPSILKLGDNLRIQAFSLYQQDKFAEAEKKIAETLKIYREGSNSQYINYPTALVIQGLIFNKTNRIPEAEKVLREAFALRQQFLPKEHFLTALAESALGECLTTQKRYTEARPLLEESYESLKNSQGANNPRTLLALSRLTKLEEECKTPLSN